MAGVRNTEGAALDTTIGTLLTEYQAYADVAATGETPHAPAVYFLRSLLSRLEGNAELKNHIMIMKSAHPEFKPVSVAEAASATLVLIDPNSIA